jgi:hypothetical protein
LAGIVAGATKEKGNAIPGVAIATALMPPLCTAGFGVATGNIYYFLGAFYLFFINAVMISLSTFLIVRFLKFPLKQAVDATRASEVKKYIYVIVTLTVLPSVYFGYQIIQQALFQRNALAFISAELTFEKTQVINKTIVYAASDSNRIELLLAGERLNVNDVEQLEKKMADYSLFRTRLILKQGIENVTSIDVNQIKSGILEEIYQKNERAIKDKDEKIEVLENEILQLKINVPLPAISEEINAINPKIKKISAYKTSIYDIDKQVTDTIVVVYLSAKPKLGTWELHVLNKWLIKRLDSDKVKLMTE